MEIGALAEMLNYAADYRDVRPGLSRLAIHDESVATYYGFITNQRSGSAAIHTVAHRHGLSAYGINYAEETDAPLVPFNLTAATVTLSTVIKTKNPVHIPLILVWAAHTHLIKRFRSTFYLAFQGRSGSGKGTAVESCILLTPDGEVLSDATDAYLSTVLDEGKALGIEEWDILARKNPGIEGIVRNGYRRGVFRGFKVPKADGRGWDLAKRSLFGPKVYDTHAGPSGHLLGRSIVIKMDPDDSVDRALDAEDKNVILTPLKLGLARLAKNALAEWSAERVAERQRSPEFRRRVAAMAGRTGRDHVIAAVLLLTCDMLGWDLEEAVRSVLASRTTMEEFGLEAEVMEVLGELIDRTDPNAELRVDSLLEELNHRREASKIVARVNSKILAGALSELGFKRPEEWGRAKGGPQRDKSVVRPYRILNSWASLNADTTESSRPSGPSGPLRQDEMGGMGTMGGIESPTVAEAGADPEDLFGDRPTRADRARAALSARLESGEPPLSKRPRLTPEIDPSPLFSRSGLNPEETFPGIRFHRVVGESRRIVLVSRSSSREIGQPWVTSQALAPREEGDKP